MSSIPEYRLIKVIGSGVFGTQIILSRLCFLGRGQSYQKESRPQKNRESWAIVKQIILNSETHSRQLKYSQTRSIIGFIQNFFFTKNDKGKLIQNMTFEFLDDNLESLIERNIKKKTKISEPTIKVSIIIMQKYMFQLLKGLEWIH